MEGVSARQVETPVWCWHCFGSIVRRLKIVSDTCAHVMARGSLAKVVCLVYLLLSQKVEFRSSFVLWCVGCQLTQQKNDVVLYIQGCTYLFKRCKDDISLRGNLMLHFIIFLTYFWKQTTRPNKSKISLNPSNSYGVYSRSVSHSVSTFSHVCLLPGIQKCMSPKLWKTNLWAKQ